METDGISDGNHGVLQPERYPHGGITRRTPDSVGNIAIRKGRSSARPIAAIPFATEYLDRLHITAASHGHVIVVEVLVARRVGLRVTLASRAQPTRW